MNTRKIDSVLGEGGLSSLIFGGAMTADEFESVFPTLPPSSFVVNSHDSSLVGCVPFFPYYFALFYSYGLPIEMYLSIQSIFGLLPVTNSLTQLWRLLCCS